MNRIEKMYSIVMEVFMKIKRLSPQFLVTDIKRSVLFYEQKLGFTIDFLYENVYRGISKDGYTIHLKSAAPAVEERESRKRNEHADIIIAVEHIDVLYVEIKSRSVTIHQPLREMPYGKEFYILDPDDYVIAYVQEK